MTFSVRGSEKQKWINIGQCQSFGPAKFHTTINDIYTPTHPHDIRRIGARSSARSGRATLWDGSKREATRGVRIAALASPLVQAFFLLLFADLNLRLVAASTGLISAYAGLEQFRALEGLKSAAGAR